jgi:peptide/nickel transport system permease protein
MNETLATEQREPSSQRARRRFPWLRRMVSNRLSMPGYLIVLMAMLLMVIGPLIAPYSPTVSDPIAMLMPPSSLHLLGTDELGRDLLSRVIYGLPLIMFIAFGSVAISTIGGTIGGLISGYFGGWIDFVIVGLADILFSFPAILLAIAVVAVLGSGIASVTWAIGIVYLPRFLRIVRASVLQIKEQDYVLAAVALGASWPRILFRHILPNTLSPLIVQATLSLSTAVLNVAALDFLGLGVQPPRASWGVMLNGGRAYLELAPWMVAVPAGAIVLLLVGFNLAGDGLRDLLDPKQESGLL